MQAGIREFLSAIWKIRLTISIIGYSIQVMTSKSLVVYYYKLNEKSTLFNYRQSPYLYHNDK